MSVGACQHHVASGNPRRRGYAAAERGHGLFIQVYEVVADDQQTHGSIS